VASVISQSGAREKSSKGFTLLELIIALSLMAVISITATQMLRRSTTQTKKLTKGMDQTNQLRAAFAIIKNDLSQAINFRDLKLHLYNEAKKDHAKNYDKKITEWIKTYNEKEKPTPPITTANLDTVRDKMEEAIGKRPPPFKPIVEKIVTQFVGEKDKLYFTSKSGVRFRSTDKVSNLMEVGYFFRTCKNRKYPDQESKCLWRSVSFNLDEDVTQGGKESVLLEHMEDFEFKYLSFRQDETPDWRDSWDSRVEGDVDMGGQFPAAVSLKIEARFPLGKDQKKFKTEKFMGVFDISFPFNKPFERLKNVKI